MFVLVYLGLATTCDSTLDAFTVLTEHQVENPALDDVQTCFHLVYQA